MIWKIVLGIVVFCIVFAIKMRHDRIYYRERKKEYLRSEWGIYTRDEEEYSDKLWRNIRFYHDQNKPEYPVDEITWNDLSMDTVFCNMNHTRTSAGEEYLYHILRSPVFEEEELVKREKVIQSIAEHETLREEFELALYDIGKTDAISVYEYLSETKKITAISLWKHVLAAVALVLSVILLFFTSTEAIFLLFFVMGVNGYYYYKEKGSLIKTVALFEFILGTLRQCQDISRIAIPGCEEYFGRLKELADKFWKFSRFHILVSGGNTMSGSIFDSLFDYVRILSHVDLIKLSTMAKEVRKYEKELLEIYDIIGFLDSMLAIASYRHRVGEYCIPKLTNAECGDGVQHMEIRGLYHPLLAKPVKNDVKTEACMLLTGSNASGKSTFIKSVAINALFAQTIHTVLADEYKACFYRIYSSMALRDDILSSESYFIVEIKSLKRIFAKIEESEIPVLCFVDEILRGTNTVERVAASSELLRAISEKNAMCFAATHDIELTYLLEKYYANYHFTEHIKEDDILFDYLLKEGRADSRNAIRLLSMVGFEEKLVQNSRRRVEEFLADGVWH